MTTKLPIGNNVARTKKDEVHLVRKNNLSTGICLVRRNQIDESKRAVPFINQLKTARMKNFKQNLRASSKAHALIIYSDIFHRVNC